MSESSEARNKAIVLEAFDTLFNKRGLCRRGALLVIERIQ
jgi:hypothetical protein